MLGKKEKLTIEYYSSHAKEWVEKHGNGTYADDDMDELFRLTAQGKVLEVGVGLGKDAKRLIKNFGLNNYIGIEPALGLLKIAQKNNPRAIFFNKSIYELDFPKDCFDCFWISAMLIHIPKKSLLKVLKNIREKIKNNSYGFFSIMEGDCDLAENRSGRFYSLWSQSEFENGLEKSKYSVYRIRKLKSDAGNPWLHYIVKTV